MRGTVAGSGIAVRTFARPRALAGFAFLVLRMELGRFQQDGCCKFR